MENFITVVSGLPRSGTSMMMKMIEAGGMEVVTDDIRKPDKDNPKGYYEFEKVKQIKRDASWLPGTMNKAFKMVSMLLLELPPGWWYKVVFMRRNMDEILASQRKMLARKGLESSTPDDRTMRDLYKKHLDSIDEWLKRQSHIDTLYLNYNEVLETPFKKAKQLSRFLLNRLDVDKMAGIVDRSLYRNRYP